MKTSKQIVKDDSVKKKSFVQKIKDKANNAKERLKSVLIRKSPVEEKKSIDLVRPKSRQKKHIEKKSAKKRYNSIKKIQKKVNSKIQKKVSSKKVIQKRKIQKKTLLKKQIKKNIIPTKKNVIPTKKNVIPTKKNVIPTKKNIILSKKNLTPIKQNVIPAILDSSAAKPESQLIKSAHKKRLNRELVIAISGTPGTGKTTVARLIEKEFGILHLDVNSIIKEYSLSEGYDPVRRCEIIDTNKLKKALIILILKAKRPIIIDSHLSHYLPNEYVDLCIITKCSPKTLNQRLSKRGYHDAKIRENIDSEIFEVCMNEAALAGHDVYIIETELAVDLSGLKDKLKVLKHK